MAADKLFRKPSLNVVQGDGIGPMYGKVAAAATATYLYPGKLVSMLTNDGEIDIAGTADSSFNVGIIGYEDTPLAYKPATRDTIYAVADHVAIHNTPGMRFRGHLAGSQTIVTGDRLYHDPADSSGNFSKWALPAATTQNIVPLAMALESVTSVTSYASCVCWMQWL
ncbi:MAG: hypothetical protein PHF57_09860 [Methanoregula sp.]|nr:hypothetical protein [Methanoregula sp.]MDD5188495.1 hypothetical protein [Methanoregula sp.]